MIHGRLLLIALFALAATLAFETSAISVRLHLEKSK